MKLIQLRNNSFHYGPIKGLSLTVISFAIFLASIITCPEKTCAQSMNDYIYAQNSSQSYYFDLYAYLLRDNPGGTKIAKKSFEKLASDSLPKVAVDTSKKDNRAYIYEAEGVMKLKIELKDYNQKIVIVAYNLLGKKVLDIFEGKPSRDDSYVIDTRMLPNGIYICAVNGADFRITEKFAVAR